MNNKKQKSERLTRSQRRLNKEELECLIAAHLMEEPVTLAEAMRSIDADKWKAAIASETKSLQDKGTWRSPTESELATHKPIPSKWVFKYKFDANGDITRYKARLVARGDQQREGIDYEETFSPTFRLESLRIILSYAAANGLEIEQTDIVTAYRNAKIDKTILMKLPD
jgi:hypothetical protein